MNLIIGSHVSFTKNAQLLGSVKEALGYNANAFMFYTGTPQSTLRYDIDSFLTNEAFELMEKHNINKDTVMVHAPYIINLANNSDSDKYNFYIDFLIKELNRVKELGLKYLIVHPGSNANKKEGILSIATAINKAFEKTNDVNILLEYMSGKGNEIGSNIDELKSIIDLINDNSRIFVCLDTCHMNDSGIDLNNFDIFLDEFDKKIGINKIKCFHINDSMNERLSHKDRHENIGYGTIGFDALINVIYNKRLSSISFILETPYINRNSPDAYPPYKYEIENIINKKFKAFK